MATEAPSWLREVTAIVIHHSATARSASFTSIEAAHKAKGWRAIGYHYVILADGSICTGRPVPEQGAAQKGANLHSIGVCVIGDNTKEGQGWSAVQKDALHRLVNALRLVFPHAKVLGHKHVGVTATACPGIDLREVGL